MLMVVVVDRAARGSSHRLQPERVINGEQKNVLRG